MQIQSAFNDKFQIYYLSEQSVTLEFGQDINEGLLKKVTQFSTLVHQKPFPGFCTTVPAYATLSIFFDPLQVIKSADLPGKDCFEKVSFYLQKLKNQPVKEVPALVDTITIPVCYGGTFGPDLEEVASLHNLTAEEVITLHTSSIYKVYMIGFVPGFAYLGGMPDLLETPRKPAPRKAVPAGSMGIAGKQTGIYPLETPGGWQIIGRTPITMFNAEKEQPILLKSGDQVVFKRIGKREFDQYCK